MKIGGVDIRPCVDLGLGEQAEEILLKKIGEVIEKSASLSLDSAKDRETLLRRLRYGLTAIR